MRLARCSLRASCSGLSCRAAAASVLYTLSLHDALPISPSSDGNQADDDERAEDAPTGSSEEPADDEDRKSTRLNSSHVAISYAVFCVKNRIRIEEVRLAGLAEPEVDECVGVEIERAVDA